MLSMKFAGLMLGATLASSASSAKFMAPSTAPSHEDFTALLRVEGKPLDPMVSSLAAMAESISKQDPSAREASVNSIKTLLQGLLDSITSQHSIAQKSVTNQSAFDLCNTQKTADLAHAETVKMGTNWTDTTDAHNTCQAEFQALNNTFTSCYQQEEMLRVAATARCEYFASVDRSSNFQSWFCHEDDFPASSSYEAYLQRNIEMLADFRMRRANCTNATATQSSKQLECSGYQQQASAKEVMCAHLTPYANPADCTSYEAKQQACASYSHCRTQAQHESSSAASTADQLAESLKVQWEGLKRIECLLDVIAKGGDQTALQACVAAGHDTSALSIIVPAAPAAQACDVGVAPAGCA
mmetsp:Transcript_80152/g.98172  ORF Transcript_80152/g.98172 Transcript_80152/m.98172 type:complete len:356 (+) Transcript_80152:51-1118(+)